MFLTTVIKYLAFFISLLSAEIFDALGNSKIKNNKNKNK